MSYYTKITKAGLAAITAAMNNNTKVPITYMAFGDGNGYIPEPNENANSLVNEVYRVGVNKVEVHSKNPNWLVCEAIIPSAVGGFNIREVALYDNSGNTMLAVASYPPTYKPSINEGAAKIQTIRIVIQVDNSGNFELIVDPDVVLVTVESLNEARSDIYKNTVSAVNTINDLLSLVFWNGRTVSVKEEDSIFYYDSTRSSENDGGTVFNGWVRKHVLFVTPRMFQIKPNDNSPGNGEKFNALFNSGYPVLIDKNTYFSDSSIIINDKDLSISGSGKNISRIAFSNKGDGLVQKTSNGLSNFSLNNAGLVTSVEASENGSGFKYDSTEYLSSLLYDPLTAMKKLEHRTVSRGNINNFDFGNIDGIENNVAWKTSLEFIGAMNYSVDGLYMRLSTDLNSDGVWIHGEGMPTDMHFNNIYSFYGNSAFRMNDYLEGFHLTNFELINCNYGILNISDEDTIINVPTKIIASYIAMGHILSHKVCILCNFLSSSKMIGLELYIGSSDQYFISQCISVLTADCLSISNNSFIALNSIIEKNASAYAVQIGTGWGNSIIDNTFKGEKWNIAIALGTNNTFYGNTVSKNRVKKAQTALHINTNNCIRNSFEPPIIIDSVDINMSSSIDILNKNSVTFHQFHKNLTFGYVTDIDMTLDISELNLTEKPISIDVQEVNGVFGGIQYIYRKDISTKTELKIEIKSLSNTPSTSDRSILIRIFGF